jgi:hypothetical protein
MKKAIQKMGLMLCVLALAAVTQQLSTARAQGTAFTYQGRLNASGSLASGLYDFVFSLSNAPSGGSQVGGSVTNLAVGVTNGLFTTTLDFGTVFAGIPTWLAISVRTNGTGNYAGLTPLQQLTSTPYAIFANTASNVSGTVSASQLTSGMVPLARLPATVVTNGASGVTLTGTFNGLNGSGTGYWNTNGNAGANPTNGVFLGTTDNLPLEMRVNRARALRLEPDSTGIGGPNVIGGFKSNSVAGGVQGATIAGGGGNNTDFGSPGVPGGNSVQDNFGTVGGGWQNIAGDPFGANGGPTVAGGIYNSALGDVSAIGGGWGNTANGFISFIGGGEGNQASGSFSTVAGGNINQATGNNSFVGGGYDNLAAYNKFVGDGYSTVAGGYTNQALGDYSTVGGGNGNSATGDGSFVGGGGYDGVNFSNNLASGNASVVSGGFGNSATNNYATVPGGANNVAGGQWSFAAGQQAQATNDGSFVWADSQPAPFSSTNNDSFNVRAQGGVYFQTAGAGVFVDGSPLASGSVPNNPTFNGSVTVNGTLSVSGQVTAQNGFLGDGSQLQNLSPANLQHGTAFININGTATTAITANAVANGSVNGASIAPNAVVKSLNGLRDDVTLAPGANVTITPSGNTLTIASTVTSGFWSWTGNAGTTPGINFIGTTDPQPLEFDVNGVRALRLEPDLSGINAPNVIGGFHLNSVSTGVFGATIGGGGKAGYVNAVTNSFAVVGGGYGNTAGGQQSFVGGGVHNVASADYGIVVGGFHNTASGLGSFVGGGGFDGYNYLANSASGAGSFIGGGLDNATIGNQSTVGGGEDNQATGSEAFIGGGAGNVAGGGGAMVGGGSVNQASGGHATVAGGELNVANGGLAFVGGGVGNTAGGSESTVSGGQNNYATNDNATVGGGYYNSAGGFASTVAGGFQNYAANNAATVAGGYQNNATNYAAIVVGGANNLAGGQYSLAAGRLAQATNDGAFVWADSQNAPFGSTGSNQFCIRAQGGVQLDKSTSLSFGSAPRDMLVLYTDPVTGDTADIGMEAGSSRLEPIIYFHSPNGQADYRWYTGSITNGTRQTLMEFTNGNLFVSGAVAFGAGCQVNGNTTLGGNTTNNGSATINGFLTVNSGATIGGSTVIGGSASINGPATISGYAEMDNGAVINNNNFNVNNAYNINLNSKYDMKINADIAGYDAFDNKGLEVSPALTVDGDIYAEVVFALSDRNVKTNFEAVAAGDVLAKVAALPISTWNFKTDLKTRHIGPMAQDFHAAFGSSGGDDTHIALVDEGGVALAAIQGLNEKVESGKQKAETQVEELKSENAELKARLEKLELLMTGKLGGAK